MDARYGDPGHLPYHQTNMLMMCDEFLTNASNHISDERKQQAQKNLTQAAQINKNGAAWDLKRLVVIGQKPVTNKLTEK